jgi:hypothetical protein
MRGLVHAIAEPNAALEPGACESVQFEAKLDTPSLPILGVDQMI